MIDQMHASVEPSLSQLNEVFLRRELDLCDPNGVTQSTVILLIDKPIETMGNWLCSYQIIGLEELDASVYAVYGIDSVQALMNAFKVIEGTLAGTDVAKRGLLRWCGDHQPHFLR